MTMIQNISNRTEENHEYTGHTQKNGAVSKEFTFDTAPFFCVFPVLMKILDSVLNLFGLPGKRSRIWNSQP
jgi:hypothetical protein